MDLIFWSTAKSLLFVNIHILSMDVTTIRNSEHLLSTEIIQMSLLSFNQYDKSFKIKPIPDNLKHKSVNTTLFHSLNNVIRNLIRVGTVSPKISHALWEKINMAHLLTFNPIESSSSTCYINYDQFLIQKTDQTKTICKFPMFTTNNQLIKFQACSWKVYHIEHVQLRSEGLYNGPPVGNDEFFMIQWIHYLTLLLITLLLFAFIKEVNCQSSIQRLRNLLHLW